MRLPPVFLVLLVGCAAIPPPPGTREHEVWCFRQRAARSPPAECGAIYERERQEKEAARAAEEARRAELQRQWDEFAREKPYEACVIWAQVTYKQCLAVVKDEASAAAQQAAVAQRHRDKAALLMSQPRSTYSTPTAAAVGAVADTVRQTAIADNLRKGAAQAPYDAQQALYLCRETYGVDVDACTIQHGEPRTAPPAPAQCCKQCGPSSQPCGDTCISLGYTCHTAPGCACP